MKKQDLVTGMIVEHRNGNRGLVLRNSRIFDGGLEDAIISLVNGNFLQIDYFDDNMTLANDNDWDIMKVCDREFVGDNIRAHILYDTNEWTWTRSSVMRDLEKLFKEKGYQLEEMDEGIYIESQEIVYASVVKETLAVDFDWSEFERASAAKRIEVMELVGEVLLALEQQ